MKLFQHSQGFIFSIGFDPIHRIPTPNLISWCDPLSKEWDVKPTNQAGTMTVPFDLDPDFVRECGNKVIIHQDRKCIEMEFIGPPYIFNLTVLHAD